MNEPIQTAPYQVQPTDLRRKRPGTVTGAAVLTWVFSGLALIGGSLFALSGAVARDQMVEELKKDDFYDELGMEAETITDLVVGFGLVTAALSVIAIVVAVMAFAGSQIGRILLVVISGIAAAIALVASLAIVPFLWVIAAVCTIVLLFTGGANEWYADRRG